MNIDTEGKPVLVIKIKADGSWEGYKEIEGEIVEGPLKKQPWPKNADKLPDHLQKSDTLLQRMFVFNLYKKNPCTYTYHDGFCDSVTITYNC